MVKRDKRLKKQVKGIEKSIEKHLNRLAAQRGRYDTTHEYWISEIERLKSRKDNRKTKMTRKRKRR